MHITFREVAQRMGLQTVRAIYPEDVDICLNFAIIAKTRSIIAENANAGNDLVLKANADISQLNALRNLAKEARVIPSPTGKGHGAFEADITNDSVMYYTRFAVGYDNNAIYDCRLIEAEYLNRTLQDYCNRPTKRNPICVSLKQDDKNIVDIYTGKENVIPIVLVYNYVKIPNHVHLDETNSNNNIDCDMPDYLIPEIIELAVQYYKQSFTRPNEQKVN